MHIDRLSLINFRSYSQIDIEFSKGVNFITGKNGQGKTNIVEAIYMLSFGKSFRTSRDLEMIRFGCSNLYISGDFTKNNAHKNIEIAINKEKKGIRINRISVSRRIDLFGHFNVVIFSPEDLRLVKDGPRERRNFIDREISQILPRYYSVLYDYNRILKNRNKYLKSFEIDEGLLDVYDRQLSELAGYIYVKRRDYIRVLSEISSNIHSALSENSEALEIRYKNQISLTDDDDEKSAGNKLYEILVRERKRDEYTRGTGYGIHRDDISLYINSMDLKMYGSQGQQRTASIALKLSEVEMIYNETGEYPVLILDDVFSELDITRQRMLVSLLESVQMFITGAQLDRDSNIFANRDSKMFLVKDGSCIDMSKEVI